MTDKVEKELRNQRIETYDREIAPYLDFDPKMFLSMNGFFDAPASTKYHGAYPGGLFDHSMNVTRNLLTLTKNMNLHWGRIESPYIIGFFHDICKMDQYVQKPGQYTADGQILNNGFHYEFNKNTMYKGHGDKSVLILSTLTQLTEEEVACILYHMGSFTEKELWNDYTGAIHAFQNVLFTHMADMMAAHITEVDT